MAGDKEYIRLPGRRRITLAFSRTSLYLGKDHLLYVKNRGYSEEYRRFFYRDIQAIFLRQTPTYRIINTTVGIVVAFHLLLLSTGWFLRNWESYVLIPLAGATFFWLLLFVFQFAAGPTCICHLRTAVQFEQLPSLFRVRAAKKAIAMLRHRVETVQGGFSEERISG